MIDRFMAKLLLVLVLISILLLLGDYGAAACDAALHLHYKL